MNVLRETALLGTEKKALDIQLLPDSIKQLMHQAQATDPEWEFLEACAYYTFYESAGRLPKRFTGLLDEAILQEEKIPAPKEVMDLYTKLELIDHTLRERSLNLWLDVLNENEWIVSADRLAELVYDGKHASNVTKTKILSVIGKKGMWIVQNDARVSYALAPAGDLLWADGTITERKNMFLLLRQRDPVAAIELLKSTWSREAIVNKKTFLELIRQTTSSTDLPFIDELYASEFKQQPKEKKTEKECRRIIASILLRHPESALYKTTTEKLLRYVNKGKKGIVGFVTGQAGNTFRLPDEEDDFWNGKFMDEVYGFESKGFDIALYNSVQQFWLALFIEYLPFSFWTNTLEMDHKKAVQFWLLDKTTISGASVPVFQQALVENARCHQDRQLAFALIQSAQIKEVLPLLDSEMFETYVSKNNYAGDAEVLINGPYESHQSWSPTFSEQVIHAVYKLAEQNHASAVHGKLIAQFAHVNALSLLYQLNSKARETAAYNNWNNSVFQLAQPSLELRVKIQALKNK